MERISDEIIWRIGDDLRGTCNSIGMTLVHLDLEYLDVDAVEDRLLDISIELCKGCGWWFESSDLSRDDEGQTDGYCDQCAEDRWQDAQEE